jgi:hypothetical protein
MKNYEKKERRVGFEIEFQNLTPKKVAQIITDCIEGEVIKESDASYLVKTSYGEFKAETDAKLLKQLAKTSEDNIRVKKFDFEGVIKDILKPLTEELVPTELVSPPLEESQFDLIKKIEQALIKAGAKGTNESAYFAFAAQFNPEIVSKDSDHILNVLRAYILLTPWLRAQIHIDLTRELTSYVDDFPKEYAKLILEDNYSPDLEQLIDDYLKYNPTRNRGLDLLPLFMFLDAQKVRKKVKDDRVKARPTFHYRLPSCQFGLDSWHVFVEWKRWVLLERLAKDITFLKKMSKSYLRLCDSHTLNIDKKWLQTSNHYIEDFRS